MRQSMLRTKTIWISIWDDEKGRLHLTVKDNGKGFDVRKGKKREDIMGFLAYKNASGQ